jgi:hypothetical protein
MRTLFVAVSAICLAVALPQGPAHAQYIQVPVPGFGQQPPPEHREDWRDDREHREHCDALAGREHELRDRYEHTPPSDERERVAYRLREVHDERERCWHH